MENPLVRYVCFSSKESGIEKVLGGELHSNYIFIYFTLIGLE